MKNLNRFLYLLDRQAKKKIPFLIIAFLICSMLDVLGIGLIGLFLGLVTSPNLLSQKISFFIPLLKNTSEKNLIIYAGFLITAAFVSKTFIILFLQNKITFFCYSLAVRIKTRMMKAYQFAPYIFHLQKNSAYLISKIQDSVNNYISNVLLPVLNIASSGLIAVSILLFLSFLHPLLTIFLVIMFTLIGLFFDLFVRKKVSSFGKIAASSHGEIIKTIHQGLKGLTEIRVLEKEQFFLEALDKNAKKYAQAAGLLVATQQIPKYLIENIIAIFIVGLCIGGVIAGLKTGEVVGVVGMFAAAGARLLPTVTQIISAINQIRGNFYHTYLLYEELLELNDINFILEKSETNKLDFTKIELTNIQFYYSGAICSALENVTLSIVKGQSIGIIGPSGAGKSTLINIILGFFQPGKGTLLVDGNPIKHHRAWLNNFAYIPQTIFLLDDSLRRNIAFGETDQNIDESRMWKAIQMAQLTEVVNNLPEKLNTIIGENGVRLSGGQRQRIALARAFYFERDIIIMDEATSSLDNETEKEVINTIKRLKGKNTLIVIAHRFSTIEHCDVLYRLEKGKVTSTGSFEEVVGSNHCKA